MYYTQASMHTEESIPTGTSRWRGSQDLDFNIDFEKMRRRAISDLQNSNVSRQALSNVLEFSGKLN